MAANARCYALETKLGGLLMEHRGAQRKMAKELDGRVRAMDTLRGGVEAELQSLSADNARLRAALKDTCAAASEGGVALPVAAVAELSVDSEQRPGDHEKAQGGGKPSTRESRSPSPFRRFSGRRAASPGRAAPNDPARDRPRVVPSPSRTSATGHSISAPVAAAPIPPVPAPAAASKGPMAFRRWADQSSTAPPSEGSVPPPPAPREIRAAAACGEGKEPNERASLASREASKEAAAQKHAARLKAVRTSSRGKWGFSV